MEKLIKSKHNKELVLYAKSPKDYVLNLANEYGHIFGVDISELRDELTASIVPKNFAHVLPASIVYEQRLYVDANTRTSYLTFPDGERMFMETAISTYSDLWVCNNANINIISNNMPTKSKYKNVIHAILVRLHVFACIIEDNILLVLKHNDNNEPAIVESHEFSKYIKNSDRLLIRLTKYDTYLAKWMGWTGKHLTHKIRDNIMSIRKINFMSKLGLHGFDLPEDLVESLDLVAKMSKNIEFDDFIIRKLFTYGMGREVPNIVYEHFNIMATSMSVESHNILATTGVFVDNIVSLDVPYAKVIKLQQESMKKYFSKRLFAQLQSIIFHSVLYSKLINIDDIIKKYRENNKNMEDTIESELIDTDILAHDVGFDLPEITFSDAIENCRFIKNCLLNLGWIKRV